MEINLGTSAPVAVSGPSSWGSPKYFSIAYSNGQYKLNANSTYLSSDVNAAGDIGYNLYADLEAAQAATVNELRVYTDTADVGTRCKGRHEIYGDCTVSFRSDITGWPVIRPEYLGGGSTPVNITAIAQTGTSVGDLAGIGTASFRGHGFTKSFTEHCIILGLSIMRKTSSNVKVPAITHSLSDQEQSENQR